MQYSTMTKEQYQAAGYQLMVLIEEGGDPKFDPYVDSEGYPTIGVGFNVYDKYIFDVVLQYMGVGENADGFAALSPDGQAAELAYVERIWSAIKDITYFDETDNQFLRDNLNAIMRERALNDLIPYATNQEFSFDSEGEIFQSYLAVSNDKENALKDWLAENWVDMPYSRERVALFSLAYNNPDKLLGDNLAWALKSDDRAWAWFEIRYASNANQSDGLQKRRYLESQLFGLYEDQGAYDDSSLVSDYEANKIIEFLYAPAEYANGVEGERNIDTILDKEKIYWTMAYEAKADYSLNESGIELLQDSGDLSFSEVFKPISQQLIEYHLQDSGVDLDSLEYNITGDVNLGFDYAYSDSEGSILQPLYRKAYTWSPKEGDPLTNDSNTISGINDLLIAVDGESYEMQGLYGDDVLIGANGNDVLYGGYKDPDGNHEVGREEESGDDLMFGGDGKDRLYGQDGDDVLYGGQGTDHLYGGTGSNQLYGGTEDDTYHITAESGSTNIAEDTQGSDTYIIHGAPGATVNITDSDGIDTYKVYGGATVHLNGASIDDKLYLNSDTPVTMLFQKTAGQNIWQSVDGSITATHYTQNGNQQIMRMAA